MEAITLPIYNMEGKEVDTVKLDPKVFDGTVNKAVLHQAVTAYRANQRSGLASTKTRGEVSGGGRKPWRQKGTGRARVGSSRSPLWRHGGVVFGPHPRDFSYRLSNRIKNIALKSSLNAKVQEKNLIVLDGITFEQPKTKEASRVFSNLKIKVDRKKNRNLMLVLLEKIDTPLRLSMRNISFLNFNLVRNTHAYEVLSHRRLIITKAALHSLTDRLHVKKGPSADRAKPKAA
ncbi:MAG: 50S ribosomal protein L4 [Candidatus Omnitrophota bacterium]